MTTHKIPVVIEGTNEVVYLPDDTIVDATFSTMPLGEVPREMCTDGGMKLALPDRRVGRVEGCEDEIERLRKEREATAARLEAEASVDRMRRRVTIVLGSMQVMLAALCLAEARGWIPERVSLPIACGALAAAVVVSAWVVVKSLTLWRKP